MKANRMHCVLKLALVALCCSMLPLKAQTGGSLKADKFFEGSVYFSIRLTGDAAPLIAEMNDLDRMTWHLKDADYIIQLSPSIKSQQEPGRAAFASTRLYIADSNEMYSMDMANQRAFRREPVAEREAPGPPATALPDSMVIAGTRCYAYQVVKPNERIVFYISPKYRMNTALFKGKTEAKIAFLTEGLDGCIPLRIERHTPEYTSIATATKVVPRRLPKDDFRIPAHFRIEEFDYRR